MLLLHAPMAFQRMHFLVFRNERIYFSWDVHSPPQLLLLKSIQHDVGNYTPNNIDL